MIGFINFLVYNICIVIKLEYIINNKKFTSKIEIKKYTQNILKKYPYNSLLNKDDFLFLLGLLKNHPSYNQKKGNGIKEIFIQKNNYGTKGFYLKRNDNTITDFSFNECITPKLSKIKIRLMCRNAIRPQIVEFRNRIFNNNDYVICPIINEKINKENCHIDHYPVTFEKIFQDWVVENNININDIKIGGLNEDNCENYYFIDKSLEKNWQLFHKQSTLNGLRVTSVKGNLSKVRS
jgi:hypothetical protein